MLGIISSVVGLVSSGVGGFFGFKKEQANAIRDAIGTIGATQAADAEYAAAASASIAALYQSGPPVERLWRPCLMWIIIIMLIARWFGFTPSHIDPEEVTIVYQWLEIGLIGHIPLRSVDKLMRNLSIGKILKTFIEKKLG